MRTRKTKMAKITSLVKPKRGGDLVSAIEGKYNKRCFQSHRGPWAAKSDAIESRLSMIQSGLMVADEANKDRQLQAVDIGNGIFVIDIDDVMMPRASKFGGVGTEDVCAALEELSEMSYARGVVLRFNSPGGTVEGQDRLVQSIREFGERKPIYAYVTGDAHSAAYWAAAATDHICVSRMAMVGSIGVFNVLVDTTGAQALRGVRSVLVSSGRYKGKGWDGVVDEDYKAKVQYEVDGFFKFFTSDIKSHRPEWDESTADGSTFFADEAMSRGLVDSVGTFEDFIGMISRGEEMGRKKKEDVAVEAPTAESVVVETTAVEPDAPVAESAEDATLEVEVTDAPEAVEAEEPVAEEEVEDHADDVAAAQVQAAKDALLTLAKACGIEVDEEQDTAKITEQIANTVKGQSQKPGATVSATPNVRRVEAQKNLKAYRDKYGTMKGGAVFKREMPDDFAILFGKNK